MATYDKDIHRSGELIMTLKQDMENALKDAMRARDNVRKSTLRMTLSAIKLAEVERGGELDDIAVMGIVQKEIKSRQESIDDARRAARPDLIASNEDEIKVLLSFLPKPLTEVELEELARQAIAEVGATGPREMGQVMKVLVPRLEGRATGDQASLMVRKLLIP
jgi:uncharacterized protein